MDFKIVDVFCYGFGDWIHLCAGECEWLSGGGGGGEGAGALEN